MAAWLPFGQHDERDIRASSFAQMRALGER